MVISKEFKFEAAHRLPRHEGQCARPHGHSYTFTVWITGHLVRGHQSDQSMIFDYSRLKEIVEKEIISKLDHQDLNKAIPANWPCRVDPEEHNVTTAEVLAWLFAAIIGRHLPPVVTVSQVLVKETASTAAIYVPTFDGEEEELTRAMDEIFDVAKMI